MVKFGTFIERVIVAEDSFTWPDPAIEAMFFDDDDLPGPQRKLGLTE